MNKVVAEFLKSNEKVVVINYHGARSNAAICLRSRIRMGFTYIVFWFVSKLLFWELKNIIYRFFGVKIGKDTIISADALIDPFYPELITIGEGSIIGWGAKLLTHEVAIEYNRIGRINIGKKVIIGTGSIVRSGITIGDNSIVAVSSFVNKDVPPNTLVGGVPAKVIKKL